MGLDGAWGYHLYLAARLREGSAASAPAPRPPRRRRRALRGAAKATLRAVASIALLLASRARLH